MHRYWVVCRQNGGGAQRCEVNYHELCTAEAEWLYSDRNERMPKTRDVVRLHPNTVTDHKRHQRRSSKKAESTMPVEILSLSLDKVDERVKKKALQLANGDKTRLRALSPTEVLVVNQSKQKGKAHA